MRHVVQGAETTVFETLSGDRLLLAGEQVMRISYFRSSTVSSAVLFPFHMFLALIARSVSRTQSSAMARLASGPEPRCVVGRETNL